MVRIQITSNYQRRPGEAFLIFSILAFFVFIPSLFLYAEEPVFVDALGREIILPTEPRRIISLAPNITEILYYIGLGDRVVGVTRFSNYPPEVKDKPVVGSYIDLNVEKIIDLAPDLVIGTVDGNRKKVVDLLEQAGIPVFITNPTNIKGIISAITTVGRVCGVKKGPNPWPWIYRSVYKESGTGSLVCPGRLFLSRSISIRL